MRLAFFISSGLKALFLSGILIFIFYTGYAQSNVNVRIMAANLNGDSQTYEPFAIRIFQGLKPDVVAIQEFNYSNNAASDFRSMVDTAFGTNFDYYREPYNGGGDIPNGIISRYPIINSGSWPDTEVANRGFAWAQIDLPGTNDLYVVSVHLLTTSAGERAIEASNLTALIQSTFPTNAWIILAGDFNTDSRTEAAMNTFGTFLSDYPVPVDNNGNSDTSENRNHPHDYVLPNFALTNFETATVLPSHSFPSGLVFDSTVYTPLSDVAPVLFGDSTNAQHMAVMKDFFIPTDGTGLTTNAPAISTQPKSQTVVPGSNVTFTITATGTAPLGFQWLFGETNIADATTNFYSIANVQTTNAGDYSVIVTNIAGSVTSAVATLTVVASPVITTNPADQSVVQGNTANFSVTAIGIQPLTYQWLYNGTNIFGATTNFYSIANIQTTNAGNYSVIVTNIAGSVTSSAAMLTVTFATTGTVVTLAGWDVSGQSSYGMSPMSPTTNTPVVTVGGLTRGGGVTTINTAAARTWGGNGFDATSSANAILAGDYATFSITANAGYTVSFTSISQYDYKRSSSGPPNGVLQFQIGSGAFANITNVSYTSTSGDSLGPIDLSSIAALQNIAQGITVTFRIVNYGATSSGGNWYVFDKLANPNPDLAVQGIINVIPPASPAVLSMPAFSAGQFQLLVTGTSNSNYIVQSSTNLATPDWMPIFTNVSPYIFTDVDSTAPQKFYRATSSP